MKVLKYNLCRQVNHGTVEAPLIIETFNQVTMTWSKANEEIARKEAYNGEYTIEDDGRADPAATPTQLDAIEAQVAYTAMMTDTLLPEV